MKLLTIDKNLIWMAPADKSQSAKYIAKCIFEHLAKHDAGEKLN